LEISRVVTEYRAQILEDAYGKQYVADFPEGITRPIQYGQSIKSHAVYLSQFQLIPYERVADYFMNEANIAISVGSLCNFNQEAFARLETFDQLAQEKLTHVPLLHVDETGINVGGKRIWLHTSSNEKWAYFYPHEKRGQEAMDAIGILPKFQGILIHDHWKPYYTYTNCTHALCNAHHIRELQWVIDNPGYQWAQTMQEFLLKINEEVKENVIQSLDSKAASAYREQYRQILEQGVLEIPQPIEQGKKRGRQKKEKALNLLERLKNYEDDVLRFMEQDYVPFTNNQGENDIRMTKVQQKISGCFKSMEGAKIFCRIRSYLLTAQKQGISPAQALKLLFDGKLPDEFFT
jgi:transposase